MCLVTPNPLIKVNMDYAFVYFLPRGEPNQSVSTQRHDTKLNNCSDQKKEEEEEEVEQPGYQINFFWTNLRIEIGQTYKCTTSLQNKDLILGRTFKVQIVFQTFSFTW